MFTAKIKEIQYFTMVYFENWLKASSNYYFYVFNIVLLRPEL